MNIELSTPALLFPAIAILMLGYVNRYVSVANVIRAFKKDYDAGYKHSDIVSQIKTLQKRIELLRRTLAIGAVALMFACISMFLVFAELQGAGNITFGLSLIAMMTSIIVSLYETALSNKSLLMEVHDILAKEKSRS